MTLLRKFSDCNNEPRQDFHVSSMQKHVYFMETDCCSRLKRARINYRRMNELTEIIELWLFVQNIAISVFCTVFKAIHGNPFSFLSFSNS